MQTQAMKVVAMAYDEDGQYIRQYAHEYLPRGAVLESSSNDGAGPSGVSFSPTEVYRCPDCSRVEIGYSGAEVLSDAPPDIEWRVVPSAVAARIISLAEEDAPVIWSVAPEDRGQMVERAYAGVGKAGIIERTTDRSDGSVSYRMRDWADGDEDRPGSNFRPA